MWKHCSAGGEHCFVGRRERSQQDATNLLFIVKLLSQHVSDIIMPILGEQICVLPHMMFCTGCVKLERELCALCESTVTLFYMNRILFSLEKRQGVIKLMV